MKNEYVEQDDYYLINIQYKQEFIPVYIDKDDLEKVQKYSWRTSHKKNKIYIVTGQSKNKNLIDIPLDNFDMGLINTKAGIPYHDNENLSLTNKEILDNRKIEVENSNLISATQYKKEQKCLMM